MTANVDHVAMVQYLKAELKNKKMLQDNLDVYETLTAAVNERNSAVNARDIAFKEKEAAEADLLATKEALKKTKEKVVKAETDAEERAKKIIEEANNHAQQVLAKAVLEGDKRKRELAEEIKKAEAKLAGLEAFAEEWKVKAEAAKTAHDTYMTALGK